MPKRKKHSLEEIEEKLAQANELATQGKLQSEIANALGVSVMTLHRWRKASARPSAVVSINEALQFEQELGQSQRITALQLENSRLRRLVTDLLLEKMKLEEATDNVKTLQDRMTR
jgi:putative transposase